MTVHLPTIKQLQYLVALRQHGHFGKAADACFVTQSTMSAGLRYLETSLGIVLVEGNPLHGELRMGVIPTIAPFLLPVMLPRLRKEWPSLKLYLREETSQAACDALHRGQLDCVLLALPYPCGDVESEMLIDDRLFVAFPDGEAPQGSTVEVDALDENRMLLLEDGHCLKDHALSAC